MDATKNLADRRRLRSVLAGSFAVMSIYAGLSGGAHAQTYPYPTTNAPGVGTASAARFVQISQAPQAPATDNPSQIEQIQPGADTGRLPPPANLGEPMGELPFQSRLPTDLLLRPPNRQTQRRFKNFIPRIIDPENTLNLLVGHPRILTFKEAPLRLYIPDNDVARWDVITDTEIAIVGQRVGSTALTIWVRDPDAPNGTQTLSYRIRVFEDPAVRESLEVIEKQINEAFPDSFVSLSLVGDRLVVRGEVKDALEASQVLSVLIQTRNRRLGRESETTVRETDIFLDRDRFIDEEVSALRRTAIDPTVLARAGIVNLLRIPGEQQVMLRVTVAEINREAARSIGLNFRINNDQGTTVFESLVGAGTQAAAGTAQGLANMMVNLDNGEVELAINALRNLQLSRTLAEPNLTTLNGRTANFQAGGSFPVPVISGATATGLQGVQFVPFGVLLDFTPFIVDRDRIRLQIRAEVSVRDDSIGTTVGGGGAAGGGTNVAGLNTRNFTSTVELREGQTLAVAGLIQNNMGAVSDRVPLWGDLPFIGHTGGLNRVTSGEQELVILVTPELVHPLDACQTPPLPGSDVYEPTDVEFYLGNHLESRRKQDFRASVRTDWHRLTHVQKYCRDIFIIGPTGHTYGCCGQTLADEVGFPHSIPVCPDE